MHRIWVFGARWASFWGVYWEGLFWFDAMCTRFTLGHPCQGKPVFWPFNKLPFLLIFWVRCIADNLYTWYLIFCPISQRSAVFKIWILAPKACFWGVLLGAGPIRRDGLFVLKRKRKCVFCSRGVPKIRPLRSMCFVHYMHFNVCDEPKKLLSQERPFGYAMIFSMTEKTRFLLIFETVWG